MTLEVAHRHEKPAPEYGVEFRPIAPISVEPVSVACVRGLRADIERVSKTTELMLWPTGA